VDDLDDDELVRRARDGDVHAYEKLIRRHPPIAHRTAVLLAGGDGDDAVKEAFVKAYSALDGAVQSIAFCTTARIRATTACRACVSAA